MPSLFIHRNGDLSGHLGGHLSGHLSDHLSDHPSAARRRFAQGLLALACLGAICTAGCSWVPPILSPNFSWTYKIDIQQGVVVTQEMAAQLKPGMTPDQVKFVMGSPPLVDPYHANRWDYPFLFLPGRGPIEARRFTVYFDKDRMVRAEGDPLPTEKEFVASRIRINKSNYKPQPEPTANQVAPKPGTGEDSGAAPSQPASTGSDPASSTTGATAAPTDSGPTIWQRVTGLFGGSQKPAADTDTSPPVAPLPPADPASNPNPDAH